MKSNEKQIVEKKAVPLRNVRVGGIQVTVWENGDFLNASIKKTYLDEKSKEWKESTSYNSNDLMKLKEAINKTLDYMLFESKEDEAEIEDD